MWFWLIAEQILVHYNVPRYFLIQRTGVLSVSDQFQEQGINVLGGNLESWAILLKGFPD